MEKETDYIMLLLLKALKGELTEDEMQAFREWKAQSAEHEAIFKRLEQEYKEKQEYALFERLHQRRDWAVVLKGIRRRKMIRRVRYGSIAASLLLVLSAGLLLLQRPSQMIPSPEKYAENQAIRLILPKGDTIFLSAGDTTQLARHLSEHTENDDKINGDTTAIHADMADYTTLEVPRGATFNLTLADGTRIILNSDSRLRFPQTFTDKHRTVYLEGEGYFRVAHRTDQPFIVCCKDHRVRVLGTTFNVSAYRDDLYSRTTLVEGLVNIEKGDIVLRLTPGMMATLSIDSMEAEEVDVEHQISWTQDQFSFQEEKVGELLKKISRWYNVEFEFAVEGLENNRLSGYIPRFESVDSVLEILEQASGMRFTKMKNTIIVNKK